MLAVALTVIGLLISALALWWSIYSYRQSHKEKEREKALAEKAFRESIPLNPTQWEILEFCRANLSDKYDLRGGSGTYWLISVDTKERIEIPDITTERQVEDMEEKGYVKLLHEDEHWLIFELTTQGRELKN